MLCPSEEVLRWFLEDELKPAAGEEVADHLDNCSACQAVLDRLTTTPDSLRNPGTQTPLENDFLQRLKQPATLAILRSATDPDGHTSPSLGAKNTSEDDSYGLPHIPGYRVTEEIGRGGMGVVYRAIDERLNRNVALKIVDTNRLPDTTRLERFRAEALATARLKHPNIIEIYDVGEHEGLAYIALEYAEQGSLRDRILAETLSWNDIAQICQRVAGAVQAAHDCGIVHRDLKPANVLFTSDGILKISDFGLAKEIGQDGGWTRTGDVIGTPSYMAPEQLAGKQAEIGPQADVYAIGAVLYELMTGKPPFKGATTVETLLQVRERDPKTPSFIQPAIPAALETICLKCLEKETRHRYGSAREVADELRRFQQHEPIHANTQGWTHRFNRWRRRHLGVFLATLAIAVLGPLLSLSVAWRLHDSELLRIEEQFDRIAAEQTVAIRRQAENQLTLLDPVAAHIMVSKNISRASFAEFASRVVALQPAITALEWVPRVPGDAREPHERAAVEDGLIDYRIRWKNEFGQFYPAEKSAVYYPVLYAEPEAPNRQALGYDLGSNSDRRDALTRSLAERSKVVTAPVKLVQDSDATPSFLAFTPVFSLGSGEDGASPVPKGLVVGVYRVRDVAAVALNQMTSAGLTLSLVDEDGSFLWSEGKPIDLAHPTRATLQRSELISIGGRNWRVNVGANQDFVRQRQSWEPLLITLLGAAVSLAIAVATAASTLLRK